MDDRFNSLLILVGKNASHRWDAQCKDKTFYLRTNPEEPPAVLLRPLTCPVLRLRSSQVCLLIRPDFEALGGRADLAFFCGMSPNTRIVTSPIFTSLGRFSDFSRNLNLVGFLWAMFIPSAGGVGGRVTGAAFKISSGRSAGRADRRASCVLEPWSVTVLSDSRSSTGLSFFFETFACDLRSSSNCLLFSRFNSSSL